MNTAILLGIICACFTSGIKGAGDAPAWGYPIQGGGVIQPDNWSSLGNICNGTRQSPINIETDKAEYDETLGETKFNDYDAVPASMIVENNGHTVHFKPTFGVKKPHISGGGLTENYEAASYHMHWGSVSTKGSEHTLDGEQYAAELHIIHTKKGMAVGDAVGIPDGVIVLTYFLEEGGEGHTNFQLMIDAMKNVTEPEAESDITPIKIQDVLPESKEKFYKYEGSLTTPGCNEAVTFYIMDEEIEISAEQMTEMRGAVNFPGEVTMQDNFRPTQELGERVVYVSYEGSVNETSSEDSKESQETEDPLDDSSTMITFNVFLIVFLGVISYFFQ